MYDHQHVPALCQSLEALCGPSTAILFALKWRVIGIEAIRLFLQHFLASERGFAVHALDCGQPRQHYVLLCARVGSKGIGSLVSGASRAVRLKLADVEGMARFGDPMPRPVPAWRRRLHGLLSRQVVVRAAP